MKQHEQLKSSASTQHMAPNITTELNQPLSDAVIPTNQYQKEAHSAVYAPCKDLLGVKIICLAVTFFVNGITRCHNQDMHILLITFHEAHLASLSVLGKQFATRAVPGKTSNRNLAKEAK